MESIFDLPNNGLFDTEESISFQDLNEEESFSPKLQKLKITRAGGCICKRAFCLKKYCSCFARGKRCSKSCSCTNCRNKIYTDIMAKSLSRNPFQQIFKNYSFSLSKHLEDCLQQCCDERDNEKKRKRLLRLIKNPEHILLCCLGMKKRCKNHYIPLSQNKEERILRMELTSNFMENNERLSHLKKKIDFFTSADFMLI